MRTMIAVASVCLAACGKGDASGRDKYGVDPGLVARNRQHTATMNLDQIGDGAKRYFYAHDSAFPIGKVGPSPAQACCSGPDEGCPPSKADWTDPTWQTLRFASVDSPEHFQYRYEGTAAAFTAIAVGDPLCDGHPITLTMTGTVVAGEPTTTIAVDHK